MDEIYTPSNGTEAVAFFDAWCRRCQRDKAMREGADFDECDDNELCELIAAAFRGPVKEWVEDESGSRCTAFVLAGDKVPEVDTLTIDLFAETEMTK
jgi:hypothetical protein